MDSKKQLKIDNIINKILEQVSTLKGINSNILPFLLLRLKVGINKYKEIISTVGKIKEIRRTSKTWISLDFYSTEGLSLKQLMPRPLHDIYFKNDLLDAFSILSKSNMSNLEEIITTTQWITHLESAKRDLLEYEIMVAKQQRNKCRGLCMYGVM